MTSSQNYDDLVIDDSNFGVYFRDVNRHKPERGDVLARFTAVAEFVDGDLKRDLIRLLATTEKAIPATNVMRKLGHATEIDATRVCKELCEDLLAGLTEEEVARKVHEYQIELFYYTKRELVPKGDPHWSTIGIANLDEFLDGAGAKLESNWKFVSQSGE
jgi:hypothetical protein